MISIPVEDEVEIRQSCRRVYAFLSDREHLPAWMAGVSRASRESPGPIGVGTRYRVVGRMMGRRVESLYEVTAYEPEQVFAGRLTSSLFEFEETYRFGEERGKTTVQLTAEAHPGGKLALLSPLLAVAVPRQVRADHRRLKAILETRARKTKPPQGPPPSADVAENPDEEAEPTEG